MQAHPAGGVVYHIILYTSGVRDSVDAALLDEFSPRSHEERGEIGLGTRVGVGLLPDTSIRLGLGV